MTRNSAATRRPMRRRPNETMLRFLPTVGGDASPGFRYLQRRRRDRRDGSGDPLGGLALLFPLGLVLAVAFLLAAFTGLGIERLLTAEDFTLVIDPGGADMHVILKRNGEIDGFSMDDAEPIQGVGVLMGSFYRLADGSIVWVPSSPVEPSTTTPQTENPPFPSASPTPTPLPSSTVPTSTAAAPMTPISPSGSAAIDLLQ